MESNIHRKLVTERKYDRESKKVKASTPHKHSVEQITKLIKCQRPNLQHSHTYIHTHMKNRANTNIGSNTH